MKDSKSVNLNIINVALMFVGAIMGAGFASGREIWQFFGVFGAKGKIGVLLVGVLFIILGTMTAYIARKLDTNEMGRIIVPGNNKKISNAISWFMAIILFTVLINMTAACGAMLNQLFGINRLIGGVLIAVLVFALLLTCIGLYISRDIFSPYVAVSGVWSIAILIYYFLPNTFYPICNDFPFALAIWLTGFFLGSVFCEYYTAPASKESVEREPNRKVLYAYVVLTCLSVPIVCGAIIFQALT